MSLFGRTLWIIGLSLFIGAVPDAVMANYLIQDHRFLDSFLLLLGAALASADTFEARLRFGRLVGMVSAEENAVQTPGTVATERRSSQILWHSR